MTCNCNDNYGCGGACDPCSSNTAIKQAVDDALAAEKETLEGYVDDAAASAEAAAGSAADAASSASAAAQSQTNAETAASTAIQAAASVTETAIVLEETAEQIKKDQENIEELISTLQTKPIYFEITTATSSITIPALELPFNVRSIYVNSARQDVGYGFTYDKDTRVITLADPITAGDIAESETGYVLITAIVDVYNSDDPTSYPIVMQSNEGASRVGTSEGITVEQALQERVKIADLASNEKNKGISLVGLEQGIDGQEFADSMLTTTLTRITDHGIGFANWPQGKAVTYNNNLYVGYNYATAHGSVVQDAMVISSHNSLDWAPPVMIAAHTATESASAWSLGYNQANSKLIAFVRFRAGSGDTAAMRYSVYESTNGSSWTKAADVAVTSSTGLDIVELHGFTLDANGNYLTAYHSIDGEMGFFSFNTTTYAFTRHMLMAAADNFDGTLLQCEANFLLSNDGTKILITARSQNISKAMPKAWVIDASTLDVITGPVATPFAQNVNPINAVYSPDNTEVWFIYANRYDAASVTSEQAGLWVGKLGVTEAFSLDFTKVKISMLCQLAGALSSAAAVAGAQHACKFGNRIVIPVASRVDSNSDRSDIFILNLDGDAKRSKLGAARHNPTTLSASAGSQKVEMRLFGIGPYQARFRMNGINLVNDNVPLNSFDFGFTNYNNGYRDFKFFTGTATPTLFLKSGQVAGANARIDLNGNTNLYGTDHHMRPGARLRVNSSTDNPGPSALFWDSTLSLIVLGSTAVGAPAIALAGNGANTAKVYRNIAGVSAGLGLRNLDDTDATETVVRGSGSSGFAVDIAGMAAAMSMAPTTGATTFKAAVTAPAFNPTSDRTLKSEFTDIDSRLIAAAKAVTPQQYILNSDPEKKLRTGFIAQDIIEAMTAAGLNWEDYSLVVPYTIRNESPEGEVTEETYYSVDYMQVLLLRSL